MKKKTANCNIRLAHLMLRQLAHSAMLSAFQDLPQTKYRAVTVYLGI